MQEPPDLDLQSQEDHPLSGGPRRQSRAGWAIALVAVAVLAAGGYWYYQRSAAPSLPEPAETAEGQSEEAARPLGAAPEPIDVPPLDMSDDVVRKLVSSLSSHPRVAAWLATDDLIRNFTVSVENVSNGQSPAGHLQALRPSGAFAREERGDRLFIAPASYERYDALADAVSSIDALGAARLYSTLKPRMEEAYRELGRTEPFDAALERAIVSLLRVPDVEGDIELEPQGAVYQYANPRLEALTPAQKQLLRMGPRNVRAIQNKLRDIGLALGIPPERLR